MGLKVKNVVCGLSLVALVISATGFAAGASATGAAATLKQAKADVAKLLVRPTVLSVPALPKKPPTGKTVDFMACGVPSCQAYGTILANAAAKVGWKVQVIQVGLTPAAATAGYDQAVINKPAGVIGSGGFPPSLLANQLRELNALRIPVILQAVPSKGGATGALLTSATYYGYGKELGEWILANSKVKNAHVAMFEATGLSIYLSTESAIKQTLAPCTSCSVSTVPFDFTTSGTTLPAAVVVYLKANPSTNYLFFDFSGAVDGVPAALQSAGITGVKILTTDTTTTESAYLKNGQENVAAGIPWPEVLWGDLNAVMRYDMKLPVAPALNVHFPNMLLTGANLPPATTGGIVPLIGNYKSIFEKAWHVGG